jgi:hypothetical protein
VEKRGRKEGVEVVDWEKLLPPRGFQGVLPRRWVVERTFSWIDHNRRMSTKDYERVPESSEALFIYVAMSRLAGEEIGSLMRLFGQSLCSTLAI